MQAGTGLLLKSNMLAVIGGLVVIAVCGDQIVMLMSGGKFPNAGLTLLLLYVNMIATSQRGVQEMVMQITGHTRALWITSIVSPLALLTVWLFGGHGLNVAVLIITAGSMTANSLAAGVLQVKTDWFRVDWRGMTAIFLPGLVGAALGIVLIGWFAPLTAGAIALLLFVMFLRVGPAIQRQRTRCGGASRRQASDAVAARVCELMAAPRPKHPGPARDQRRVLRRRGARAGPAGIAIGQTTASMSSLRASRQASLPRSGRPSMRRSTQCRCDPASTLRCATACRGWSATRQIRLLHTHTPRTALMGSLVSTVTSVPMVHHVHSPSERDTESGLRNFRNSLAEKLGLRAATRLIAVSGSLRAASSRAWRSCSVVSARCRTACPSAIVYDAAMGRAKC